MTKPLSLNVFGLEGKSKGNMRHYDCFCMCVYCSSSSSSLQKFYLWCGNDDLHFPAALFCC